MKLRGGTRTSRFIRNNSMGNGRVTRSKACLIRIETKKDSEFRSIKLKLDGFEKTSENTSKCNRSMILDEKRRGLFRNGEYDGFILS